jgi:Tfp pilus assembly protein PilF
LLAHNQARRAGEVISAYRQTFPTEEMFPLEAGATIELRAGSPAAALAAYEKAFRPGWAQPLVARYFALMKQTGTLRVFLDKARTAAAANPTDLAPTVRLFYYWQQSGNALAAERALAEFRQRKDARKSAWTVDELAIIAPLYEITHNESEAARYYYALYSRAGQENAAAAENALAALVRILVTQPEAPMSFGSGSLSLYRDVATMDPHPGFLNGILSLLLNETAPAQRYADQQSNATAYFHREKAAELVALFDRRFPNSTQRPQLRERMIESFAQHGATDGVIRAASQFLTDFPSAPNRTAVRIQLADAYARKEQTDQEFAAYDAVLAELSAASGGVPLGIAPAAAAQQPGQPRNQRPALRSPEYARILDRYVARLVALKRTRDALALYRREIDRNPDDPGLYDALAGFMEQNKLGAETEAVYQKAMARFQDRTWSHKLARWYLRQRRAADMAKLTRDVTRTFSGTDLAQYFGAVVGQSAPVGPALYLQLNLAAHARFPHNLTFVRNLLTAYSTRETLDNAAFEALLRRHWCDADDLRRRFFDLLSRTGRLENELALVRTSNPAVSGARWGEAEDQNPVAVRVVAEGEAWRSHFESAAPMFAAVSISYPADQFIGRRTAAVYRSLGGLDAKLTDASITVEERLAQSQPRDTGAPTRLGEIEGDRERFDRARGYWDRIAKIAPGDAQGYVEAATVFWDYYQYADALRLIEEGRRKLANPGLYSYEAGAVRENQHDYEGALREYARGALEQSGSRSETRLIALARRPALKPFVDQLTDNLASARNPSADSMRLRIAVLKNQGRRDDLERFLADVSARATDAGVQSYVQATASSEALRKVEQSALEKRIALEADPVERMRLRLTYANLLEGQNNSAQAAQTIDALYRENPAILGIVRSAVDFNWRNKNRKRAVDILEEAANRAEPNYRNQFTFEAARKSIEAGDYPRARTFATRLLTAQPDSTEYVAVMAETFARSNDDRGLRAFYEDRLKAAGNRTEAAANVRRALIPVLTRTRDYSGALDRYIELVNKYPEDDALAREAAIYAATNSLAAKLRAFYAKATLDSPKDYRWPLVEARIATQLEDYPAAIAAYTKAAEVRPDRADFLASRLTLEERLLRFDEVAATAARLYDLTYRDPKWMEKLAEVRARQGQNAATVEAIRKAWIEGRPDSAANYFTAADRLERWGMLAEARKFADDGVKRAAQDDQLYVQWMTQYGRLLAKMRDYAPLLAMQKPPIQALLALGQVVVTYTPDERTKFIAAIAAHPKRIELAESAGFFEQEVAWRYARISAGPGSSTAGADRSRLAELQHSRLKYAELAQQLENIDRVMPVAKRGNELEEAAACYRAAGNTGAELRVLDRLHKRNALTGPLFDRYCRLLMVQPQRLIAEISTQKAGDSANGMVSYTIAHGNFDQARQAIGARGSANGALWANAYTSLAGLYFANSAPPEAVRNAFTNALGDMTIGPRIAKPVDRDAQLAGDIWFYYGGRYGEYLSATRQPRADDFLPAMVEATPGRAEAYFRLAENFLDAGKTDAALADYRNALELNPNRADVHDRLAMIAAKAGRAADATAEWKLAIAAFTRTMDRGAVPPSFWTDLSDTIRHVGEANALAAVRDDSDKLLRTYVRRNGLYQVDGLLQAMIAASGDPAAGVAWIADLGKSAANPVQFLGQIVERDWIPEAQKEVLYRRIVEAADQRATQVFGDQQVNAEQEARRWRVTWARHLIERKQAAQAATVLASLSAEARHDMAEELIMLDLKIAAGAGRLPAQLAGYREPINIQQLQYTAADMRRSGDGASARRVEEFVYLHELRSGHLETASFLGLAQVRLEENDVAGAMPLLRRMALVVPGDPFAPLEPAAALLEKTGHQKEAAEFLTTLVKAEPWNADAKRRLAIATGQAPAPAAPAKPAGDAAAREKAWLAAAAADPKNRDPKLEVFRAAIAAGHDELAIAVGRELRRDRDDRDDIEFQPWMADQFLSDLTMEDRVTVARGLGLAYVRSADPRKAVVMYRIAQQLAPEDRARRALATAEAQMQAVVKNEGRRPLVADQLEQDRLVRPKVSAQ